MIKKGDVVIITDGSYTRSVIGGKLAVEFLNSPYNEDAYGPVKGRHYRVIETNCSFPTESMQPEYYRNDTVIQDVRTGKVVFIHRRFLRPDRHTITIDDRTIELSHESFLNLKEQLL